MGGDVLEDASALVSRHCGVIRSFEPMAKDPAEPAVPYLFRADLANHRFLAKPHPEALVATGKGVTLDAARISTLGEAVERYSGGCWEPEEVTYARRHDLHRPAVDPRQLVLYAAWQYDDLPYAPYTTDAVLGWVAARSLVTDTEVFVPALGVFMGYEPLAPHELLFPDTSNGLATGATLADAVLAAVCEVLERDAFLVTWMNRLPSTRVDPWTHPDADVIRLLSSYRRRGVEIHLNRLPTDHPCHVFMATATQEWGDGPAAVVGLGADLDPARAARMAVLEVGQVRPGLRAALRRPEKRARLEELVADPHVVSSLDDHDLLYADRRAMPAFDFVLSRPLERFAWEQGAPSESTQKLQTIVDHFRSVDGELLWSNVTPPDMAALGLHTVRAIVPGFQPMHFGWKEPRLGGIRLYELPHRLGLLSASTTAETINDAPHPLA